MKFPLQDHVDKHDVENNYNAMQRMKYVSILLTRVGV